MNKWTNHGLRLFFKLAILFLATLVTVIAGTVFHFQASSRIAGITLLAAALGL